MQPLGGVFFREQAHALKESGIQVDVVFFEPRSWRTASIAALRQQHFQIVSGTEDDLLVIRQLGWNPGLSRGVGGMLYSFLTEQLAEKYIMKYGKPDLIHVHCALWAGPAASRLKRKYNIPYVVTEHHSAVLFPQNWAATKALRKTYSEANRLISVSNHLACAMQGYVPGGAIEVVPNIVDINYFSPICREFPSSLDGPRIAAIGTLDENKSHDVLLRAFAKACVFLPAAKLAIAGEGPRREELENLVEELNIQDKVQFCGSLSREGVRDLLRGADMLVHTSKFETFGVSLIEAGAIGIPVISTKSGGPNEIVEPTTGVLVPVGDVEAISKTIISVWEKSWDPKIISEYTQRKYGSDVIIDRITNIYREVVGEDIN